MVTLTDAETSYLLQFDRKEATTAPWDDVQCLTRHGLLEMVSADPYTWVLSREGQLMKETIQQNNRVQQKAEATEQKAEKRMVLQLKLGVAGFYVSLASLLINFVALIHSFGWF